MCIFGYSGGPGLPKNNRTGLSSHLYQSTYKIWKQSVQDFHIWALMWRNVHFWLFWGCLGGPYGVPGGPLCRTQVNENFRAVRPHHRADICITREQNNCQFFKIQKCAFLAIRGALGCPKIIGPGYPLTYINPLIKYGSNPFRIF